MTTVAFIPARGGSERIPAKNLAEVGGVSLLTRAIGAALGAGCDRVVVSTDSRDIVAAFAGATFGPATFASSPPCEVHHRPADLAGPHAQIEDAIAHWLEGDRHGGPFSPSYPRLDGDGVIVLLQPTSPFRTPETVRRCVEAARAHGSALTVHHDTDHFAGAMARVEGWARVFWERGTVGDARDRPRSQDLADDVRENGCCYAFTVAHFRATRNRMGDDSVPILIDRWEALDIDTPADLAVAQAIAAAGLR